MDAKITNAELLNLYGALTQVNLTGNAKFTYVLSKNRAILKPYAEALQEANQAYAKSQPRVAEYQKRSDELIKQFAVDEKGQPVTRQSADGSVLQRVIPQAKQAGYITAREALDLEFNDVIVGVDAHNADFAKLLREEVTVTGLRALSLKDIPNEGINTQIMNLIFIFVEDDDTSKKADVIQLPKKEKPDGPASVA